MIFLSELKQDFFVSCCFFLFFLGGGRGSQKNLNTQIAFLNEAITMLPPHGLGFKINNKKKNPCNQWTVHEQFVFDVLARGALDGKLSNARFCLCHRINYLS